MEIGEFTEEIKGGEDVVFEFLGERVAATEAGAFVAHGGEVADEEFVGEFFGEDVLQGVMEDVFVVGDVVFERGDDAFHAEFRVPFLGEEFRKNRCEVDVED